MVVADDGQTTFPIALNLSKFDPSLGTLTDIILTLSSTDIVGSEVLNITGSAQWSSGCKCQWWSSNSYRTQLATDLFISPECRAIFGHRRLLLRSSMPAARPVSLLPAQHLSNQPTLVIIQVLAWFLSVCQPVHLPHIPREVEPGLLLLSSDGMRIVTALWRLSMTTPPSPNRGRCARVWLR